VTVARTYRCAHCRAPFNNPIDKGLHIRRHHPFAPSPTPFAPKRLTVRARGPRPGGSLKRETDTHPARA
jgi:hypothetical protein